MMYNRRLALTALVPMLALAACDDIEGLNGVLEPIDGTTSVASVRFVNATGTALDLATNGTVGTGMGNVVFGGTTSCTTVNTTSPNLTVRTAGTTTVLPGLTTNLASNGRYTIIAYPGASNTTQFALLPTINTPTSGSAGLRVFNATTNSFDVYTAGSTGAFTTASATNVLGGTSSNFFDVAAGSGTQLLLRNAGASTGGITLTNQSFSAGANSVLVIAPPATGTTAYRTFLVTGC